MPLSLSRSCFGLCVVPVARYSELSWQLTMVFSCFVPSPALQSLQHWSQSGRAGVSPKHLPATDLFPVVFFSIARAQQVDGCCASETLHQPLPSLSASRRRWAGILTLGKQRSNRGEMSLLPCTRMAEQFVHLRRAFILHSWFQFAAVGLNVLLSLSRASSPLTITLQTDYRGLSQNSRAESSSSSWAWSVLVRPLI